MNGPQPSSFFTNKTCVCGERTWLCLLVVEIFGNKLPWGDWFLCEMSHIPVGSQYIQCYKDVGSKTKCDFLSPHPYAHVVCCLILLSHLSFHDHLHSSSTWASFPRLILSLVMNPSGPLFGSLLQTIAAQKDLFSR